MSSSFSDILSPDAIHTLVKKIAGNLTTFSKIYNISESTLHFWIEGKAKPDDIATAYLRVIAAMPESVKKVITNKSPPRTLEELRRHKESILRIASAYQVERIRVFGSVVENNATEKSDIDFLVTWKQGYSLTDKTGLQADLQEYFDTSVDITSQEDLPLKLKDIILKQACDL